MSLLLDRVAPRRRVPRPPGPSGASLLRAFTSRQPEASGDWFGVRLDPPDGRSGPVRPPA